MSLSVIVSVFIVFITTAAFTLSLHDALPICSGVDVNTGIALEIDCPGIRQHRAILHVDVIRAGEIDRAGVVDLAAVEKIVGAHVYTPFTQAPRMPSSAEKATGPSHGRAGEID